MYLHGWGMIHFAPPKIWISTNLWLFIHERGYLGTNMPPQSFWHIIWWIQRHAINVLNQKFRSLQTRKCENHFQTSKISSQYIQLEKNIKPLTVYLQHVIDSSLEITLLQMQGCLLYTQWIQPYPRHSA